MIPRVGLVCDRGSHDDLPVHRAGDACPRGIARLLLQPLQPVGVEAPLAVVDAHVNSALGVAVVALLGLAYALLGLAHALLGLAYVLLGALTVALGLLLRLSCTPAVGP